MLHQAQEKTEVAFVSAAENTHRMFFLLSVGSSNHTTRPGTREPVCTTDGAGQDNPERQERDSSGPADVYRDRGLKMHELEDKELF